MSQGNTPPMGDNKQAIIYTDPKVMVISNYNIQMQKIADALNESVDKGAKMMLNFIMRIRVPDKPDPRMDEDARAKMFYIKKHIDYQYLNNRTILELPDSPYRKNANPWGRSQGMLASEIWEIWDALNAYMSTAYFRGYEFGGKPEQPTNLGGFKMGSKY